MRSFHRFAFLPVLFVALVGARDTAGASEPSRLHGVAMELAAARDASMLRASVQRNLSRTWFNSPRRHLGAHVDLSFARWRGTAYRNVEGQRQYFWDIGLTPVVRYQRNDRLGWYVEGGVGLHYLSDLYDNDGSQLSTRFQFGDHVGAGYVFRNGWDVGLRFQHFSNGGVKSPNAGVNFLVLRAAYRF